MASRISLLLLLGLHGLVNAQDWRTTVGWDDFKELVGPSYPDGSGVDVIQVEADENGSASINAYLANSAAAQLLSKSITAQTNDSGITNAVSNHATTVARYFYGDEGAGVNSVAQGVVNVDAYGVNTYINLLINASAASDPFSEHKVHSNAYIGNGVAASTLSLIDENIDELSHLVVAGMSNTSSGAIPDLLGTTFNTLSVGLSSNGHSAGFTSKSDYAPGRIKPELVAPVSASSWSTGAISGVAAVLYEVANTTALMDAYDHSEVMKAILMAGAVKTKFSAWDRTTTRPLDDRFGAGEVNILNSYQILSAGEKDPATDSLTGWSFQFLQHADAVTTGPPSQQMPEIDISSRTYLVTIPLGEVASDLSIILNWNHFGNTNPKNLNLSLRRMDANLPENPLVDSSESTVDNVEHIYYRNLPAGTYEIIVDTTEILDNETVEFALAWQTQFNETLHTVSSEAISGNPQVVVNNVLNGAQHIIQRSFTLNGMDWVNVHTFTPTNWEPYTWEDSSGIVAPVNGGRAFYRTSFTTP